MRAVANSLKIRSLELRKNKTASMIANVIAPDPSASPQDDKHKQGYKTRMTNTSQGDKHKRLKDNSRFNVEDICRSRM